LRGVLVFVGGYAETALDRAVVDEERAAIGRLALPGVESLRGSLLRESSHMLPGVARQDAGRIVMRDQIVPGAAVRHHLGRHSVDFHVALVAKNAAGFRIAHQQPLRHVVERRIELQLLSAQSPSRPTDPLHQPAHDEKDEGADRQGGEGDRSDDDLGFLQPLGERGGRGRRDRDHRRIVSERLQGGQLNLSVGDRPWVLEQDVLAVAFPDCCLDVRIAVQEAAVAAKQRDRDLLSDRDRAEELLEMAQLHDSNDDADIIAVGTDEPACKIGRPGPGAAAARGLAQEQVQIGVRCERPEVFPTLFRGVRPRPAARGADQPSARIDQHESVQLRRAPDHVGEHRMDVQTRHAAIEIAARSDAVGLYSLDHVPLQELDRLKRAFEMLGDDVGGRVEQAFGIRQRAIPQVGDQDRGPQRDYGRQQHTEAMIHRQAVRSRLRRDASPAIPPWRPRASEEASVARWPPSRNELNEK
jgi:hypothetical protein